MELNSKSKYNIGDKVFLEGYLDKDIIPRLFFGIIKDKRFNKKWLYEVVASINGNIVDVTVKEEAILTKNDLN